MGGPKEGGGDGGKRGGKRSGKKVRVAFRHNRGKRKRVTDLTREASEADGHDLDHARHESVTAKGDLSRERTVIERSPEELAALPAGVVVAMRGLYADVDDGSRIVPCTVRRVLRTRKIEERSAVTVGDRVRFALQPETEGREIEGVIEHVEPRRGELKRKSGRRVQTIAANVDVVVIVSSAREPTPKPHLIDRYLVAAHHSGVTPIVCMNKIDLDENGTAYDILQRYGRIGYAALATSTIEGTGIVALRELLVGKSAAVAGQSGVGKSSLLNAIDPALNLRVGRVASQTEKGRHTTTTARLVKMPFGGYVVDTPGIRSFDLSPVPRNEYEAHFPEFVEHVARCRFPDCTHTHEGGCAVKAAVESGDIFPERYDSFVQMYEEPGAAT